MPETIVNTSDYEIRRARTAFFAAFGSLDAKRPLAWDQFGYTTVVTPEQLRVAYERGGAGHGAVHRILDKCWQEFPRIKPEGAEGEPGPWEKKAKQLFKKRRLWSKLRDFDRRNMVGRFSALIYRVADGQPLNQPLGKGELVDVVPLFETQIKVTEWHRDPSDAENYGKPRMFQYRTRDLSMPSDRQAQPEKWEDVHPSRVQILAEGSVGDMFEGVPLLLAGFNHLVELEKISGGSAESFLKNSARSLVIKFDPQGNPAELTQDANGAQTGKTVRDAIQERVQALNSNVDAAIALQGGEASTLQTHQIDPQPPFEVAANLFAASVRLPFTILFGQQTGRLASDEDQVDYAARCSSRQVHDLTPMLEEFVQRMQACGAIDAGEFEIEWPPLDTPGDTEKFGVAGKMADINYREFQAGRGPVYGASEIRLATGYDSAMPAEPDPPGDGMPGEGGDPVDPVDPAQQQGGQQRPRVVAAR